jgi:two-component system sensor histidine kinase AgrC
MIISYYGTFLLFESRYEYFRLIDRYNRDLEGFKEIEKVLDNYRIINHENNNRLLTIRSMTTSKKIKNYIDNEIDNRLIDSKVLYREVSDVPGNGLRGIIYSKLLLIKNLGLEYELNIDRSVRLIDVNYIDKKTMYDVIKLIGIFIDNAIEEEKKKEDGFIIIELYNENDNLLITITNSIEKNTNIKKLYCKGKTTKGKNRGYGLALAKLIVNNNKRLINEVEIGHSEITQKIIIKNKV